MGEFKHTPGPWLIHKGEVCYRSDADDQSYGMWCPIDLEEEANARLIAAAPVLYEALRSVLDAIDNDVELTPEVMWQAQDALKLAKGE